MSDVVNKLWGFCHTLRHDGIDYGDYIEQLTYLMFLKMAHEKDIDLSGIQYEEDKHGHPRLLMDAPSSKSPEPGCWTPSPESCGPSAASPASWATSSPRPSPGSPIRST